MDEMWEVREALLRALSERDEARAELEAARKLVNIYKALVKDADLDEARAIADEQAERMKFCSRCKPVPRPWATDDAEPAA